MTREQSFYATLFESDEYTCFGNSVYDTRLYLANRQGPKAEMPFFSINPFLKGTSRSGQNIQTYRNLLFEIDKDSEGNTLSKKDQATLIYKTGMPFTTAVWSGNKSIHWIISLETPFADRMEYDALWRAIADVLKKNNVPIDAQVKDPGRFSRAAGAVRVDTQDLQNIVALKGRVSNDELIFWLENNGVEWTDYIYTPTSSEEHRVNLGASEQEKIDYIINYCMRSAGEYVEGNRDSYQFKMARLLKRTGLNVEQAKTAISQHCNGLHDSGAAVMSAYSNRYANDNPVYVWSKEEKREWAKAQEEEARLHHQTQHIQKVVENRTYDASSLDNYFYVGDELMKLKEDGSVQKWREQKFKMDFSARALTEIPNYQAFTYEPSYDNYQPIIGNYYNQFHRIRVSPVAGEWPTIHKLVSHVFSEQMELGLDYLQLIFTKPKQRLPILCLVSSEQGTGKTSFFNMLQAISGTGNSIIMDSSQFENHFNAHYATKHIIMLDEAGGFENPKRMSNKFKLWGTQNEVVVEGKGQNQYTAPFFGKLLVASNDEENFLQMDDNDSRYWVRKLSSLTAFDSSFEAKIIKEVPHFLNYLFNRQLETSESLSRLWFHQDQYETHELSMVKVASKSNLYHDVKSVVEDWFLQNPQEEEINFTLKSLKKELAANGYKSEYGQKYTSNMLRIDLKSDEPIMKRKVDGFSMVNGHPSGEHDTSVGRYYTIRRHLIMIDDVFSDDLLEL